MSRVAVAAHVHSEWSYDGSWSLEALAHAFGQRGYRAVLMAEHDRGFDADRWAAYRAACAAASTSRVQLVPGIEYASPDDAVHVPVWGSGAFLGAGRPTAEVLEAARASGRLAVVAHPRRRDAWRRLDPGVLRLAHGIELWNRKYDGWAPGAEAARLLEGTGLLPYVGLDFHTARQFAPLAMTVPGGGHRVVDEDAVLSALASGQGRATVAGRISASRFGGGPLHVVARRADRIRRRGGHVARRAGVRR